MSAGRDQVRFTETMTGWVSSAVGATHEDAAREGRNASSPALFTLTVVTPDVQAMVEDPAHRSPTFGMMLIPALSAEPLGVEGGSLDLFVDAAPHIVHMRYELRLATADRRRYTLRGIKEIVRRRWFPTALWDTTTLFVDIWAGDEMAGRPKLRGVLTMGPGAVLMQGLSFRGAGSWFGLGAIVRFMRYYLARCAHVYLGPRTAPIRPQWSAVEAAGAAGN